MLHGCNNNMIVIIILANLPGARQERFTAEETDVLVRAVKDREVTLNGDGSFFFWFLMDKLICQMSFLYICV